MGPRAGLDGRKIMSSPGFDPGPSSPWSVAIPTELPGPQIITVLVIKVLFFFFANLYETLRCDRTKVKHI